MSGQCDLVRKHKLFYLMVSVDIPEQPSIEPKNVIGVDMGIVNISPDSTGKYYSGDEIRQIREHNSDLRSRYNKKYSCFLSLNNVSNEMLSLTIATIIIFGIALKLYNGVKPGM